MKKYLPLIATALLALSQSPLYGMDDENSFFEGFNTTEENRLEASELTDLFTSLTTPNNNSFDSNSSLKQAIDLEYKDLILPPFNPEELNIKDLLSSFLTNTTDTVPVQNPTTPQNSMVLQKKAPPSKKHPRENNKKHVKNQSKQKKTCLNNRITNSTNSGSSSSQSITTGPSSSSSSTTNTWTGHPHERGNQKNWNQQSSINEKTQLADLFNGTGTSTEILNDIKFKSNQQLKSPKAWLNWLFKPREKSNNSIVQQAINQNNTTGLKLLEFILNLVIPKINSLHNCYNRINLYQVLADELKKCILTNTTPECSELIKNVITTIEKPLKKILHTEDKASDIFIKLNQLLNKPTQLSNSVNEPQPQTTTTITQTKDNDPTTVTSNKELDNLMKMVNALPPTFPMPTQLSNSLNTSSSSQNQPLPTATPTTQPQTTTTITHQQSITNSTPTGSGSSASSTTNTLTELPPAHESKENLNQQSSISQKAQIIATLFNDAGTSEKKLNEIKETLTSLNPQPSALLKWFSDPTEKSNDSVIQQAINKNNPIGHLHLRFILNLLNHKIHFSIGYQNHIRNYQSLAEKLKKCITTPECSQLIKNVKKAIKNTSTKKYSSPKTKAFNIFEELNQLFSEPTQLPNSQNTSSSSQNQLLPTATPTTQPQTTTTITHPQEIQQTQQSMANSTTTSSNSSPSQSITTAQSSSTPSTPNMWTGHPPSHWNQEHWGTKTINQKAQTIATLFKDAETSEKMLQEIKDMLNLVIKKPVSSLKWLLKSTKKSKVSFIQQAINKNNTTGLTHLKLILNILNAKIHSSISHQNDINTYLSLADELEKCIPTNTLTECSKLIKNVVTAIKKIASKKLIIEEKSSKIFNALNKLLNNPTQLSNSLNTSSSSQNQLLSSPTPATQPQITTTIAQTKDNGLTTDISDEELDDLLELTNESPSTFPTPPQLSNTSSSSQNQPLSSPTSPTQPQITTTITHLQQPQQKPTKNQPLSNNQPLQKKQKISPQSMTNSITTGSSSSSNNSIAIESNSSSSSTPNMWTENHPAHGDQKNRSQQRPIRERIQIIVDLLENTETSTEMLNEIKLRLNRRLKSTKTSLNLLFKPMGKSNNSIVQKTINKNNTVGLSLLKFILNILNHNIDSLQSSYNRINSYQVLADELKKCILTNATPEYSNLINSVRNAVEKPLNEKLSVQNKASKIFDTLKQLLNNPNQLSNSVSASQPQTNTTTKQTKDNDLTSDISNKGLNDPIDLTDDNDLTSDIPNKGLDELIDLTNESPSVFPTPPQQSNSLNAPPSSQNQPLLSPTITVITQTNNNAILNNGLTTSTNQNGIKPLLKTTKSGSLSTQIIQKTNNQNTSTQHPYLSSQMPLALKHNHKTK